MKLHLKLCFEECIFIQFSSKLRVCVMKQISCFSFRECSNSLLFFIFRLCIFYSYCEDRSPRRRYFYRKTISRFNDKSIIIEEKSREYTRKYNCKINQCFFIIEHRILYKQITNKNLFMFKFVSYSIQDIFFQDSKFISSLEEWISRNFMNIVINDSLNRWHLKNFIKNDKNEITFNDCLKHFHRMKIWECHITKQNFARIFNRYHSIHAQNLQSAMSNRLTSMNQDNS